MRLTLALSLSLFAAAKTADAAHTCPLGAIDALKLSGRSPRDIRNILTPVLGAPISDTNRLPDGGTFAKLDIADQQDGVSQTFAWGAEGGVVEIVYQRGRAQVLSARLEDSERASPQCKPWPRETLAAQIGIKKLGKSNVSRRAGKWAWLRFEPRLTNDNNWLIRMHCTPNGNECTAITVYLPTDVVPSQTPAAPSAPVTITVDKPAAPRPAPVAVDHTRAPLN